MIGGGLLQSSILRASSETVFSRKKPPQSKPVQPPRTLWLLEGGGLVASPRATGTCDQGNWMLANFLWNQPQPAQFSLLLFRRFFRFRVLKFAHIF